MMAPDKSPSSVPSNVICRHMLRRSSFNEMALSSDGVPSTFAWLLQAALKRRKISLTYFMVAAKRVKRGGYFLEARWLYFVNNFRDNYRMKKRSMVTI